MTTSRLRLSLSLLTGLAAALAAGCQVDATGTDKPGLIDIEECQDCQLAFAECVESGRDADECQAMMQECFVECDVPDVPVDCGCDAIYDQCVASDEDQDPSAPGGSWACEQIYQECAFACEEPPPPPGRCAECDQLLLGCFEEAREADDPLSVLTGCIDPYVECRITCELGDGGDGGGQDGEDPGQGDCFGCEVELQACFEGGGSEEECFGAFEQCAQQCQGDGGQDPGEDPQDPGQPPGDDAGCYEQFEECLWSCGDTTSRGDCEETLIECLGA